MASDVIHIHNPIERDFTMVPNRLWTMPGLSVTAKAVFAYLLSWRDGSAVRVAVIEDALSIGRDARRSAFKQLEAAGLLRIEVKNLDRGRFVTLRTVDASPLLVAPGPENPSPVAPGPEKPSPVNQAVKGRISTPAPPENPSPYKDKTRQKNNFASEFKGKSAAWSPKPQAGSPAAKAADPSDVLAFYADMVRRKAPGVSAAVSSSMAQRLLAAGLVSVPDLRAANLPTA